MIYVLNKNHCVKYIHLFVYFRPVLLTANEIFEAYEEKLEFNDDKEMIIENVSFVGLTDFAPEAKRKEIQKALEKGKIFSV